MESINYKSHCIRTVTGKYVNVFDPDPEAINIMDISYALSHIPRYGGHTYKFYSVAQHSILCYYMAPRKHKLAALLHDASEAYLLDIPRPIKKQLERYEACEDHFMSIIAEKYNFQYPFDPIIKEIDNAILEYEWEYFINPDRQSFICLSPESARARFFNYFHTGQDQSPSPLKIPFTKV